jgi:hypothetical protein
MTTMNATRHFGITILLTTLLVLLSVTALAGEKANDTVTITSLPDGATVEWNRKVVGTTPLTYTVGEYAFNSKKSSLFSKRLNQPIVLRVSKEGYFAKELTITKELLWSSFNGQNHFVYFIIRPTASKLTWTKLPPSMPL